jgi:hypothetical protein
VLVNISRSPDAELLPYQGRFPFDVIAISHSDFFDGRPPLAPANFGVSAFALKEFAAGNCVRKCSSDNRGLRSGRRNKRSEAFDRSPNNARELLSRAHGSFTELV